MCVANKLDSISTNDQKALTSYSYSFHYFFVTQEVFFEIRSQTSRHQFTLMCTKMFYELKFNIVCVYLYIRYMALFYILQVADELSSMQFQCCEL